VTASRRLPALALALALGAFAASASSASPPRLVRVPLGPQVTLARLLEAGLDIVTVKAPACVEILEWPGDAATLERLGAAPVILDEFPGLTAARRARAELSQRPRPPAARVRSATGPDGTWRIEALPPVGSGSLGGFWTLAEIKMKLDSLVAGDPADVVADKLDTLGTTLQGRPIWGLAIGRAVSGPDTRPVVYLNALTHAREPGGMHALFAFVDDLLANYGTDPWARTLLDQRVIYVCPVVNPDGYRFNQTIYDSTGGFGYHRKNLRDSNGNHVTNYVDGNNHDGVDLNRNFGDHWGYPNGGSSGSSQSAVYRGTAAFSEPETQAQRNRVVALRPRTAISFHTYSDLLVHPYGWTTAGSPDSMAFYEWDDEMSAANGYNSGGAPRVLYPVNGEFSDWMYGDTLLKPRAFSWTPEVGNQEDGFWPPPSRIVPLALENLRTCYTAAAIAGYYPRVENATLVEGTLDAGHLAHVALRVRNLGLAAMPAGVTARLVAADESTEVILPLVECPALGSLQSGGAVGDATFEVAAHPALSAGHRARFRVEFSGADGYFSRDSLELITGTPTTVFADAGTTLAAWKPVGPWGIVSGDPLHPSAYIADSPTGAYGANADYMLALAGPLDLSSGAHAYAMLGGRWALESDYDGATFEASLDSVTWTPLAGRWTLAGTGLPGAAQATGLPVLRGTRQLWKREVLDLSGFAGAGATRVRLRARLRSDVGTGYDGLDFDSLRVLLYDPAAQPAPAAVGAAVPGAALALAPPAPNPARGFTRLAFTLPRAGEARLEILDVAGRRVRALARGAHAAGRYSAGWDLADDAGRPVPAGLYFARLSAGAEHALRRIAVLH
jgi:hypothetical protein